MSYRAAASGDGNSAPMLAAVTRNLGAGGAFVLCEEPLPTGTRVELVLHLPRPARDIDVLAEVRWRLTAADGPGPDPDSQAQAQGAGMGLQFVNLAVDDLLALKEYFASLTGTDVPA